MYTVRWLSSRRLAIRWSALTPETAGQDGAGAEPSDQPAAKAAALLRAYGLVATAGPDIISRPDGEVVAEVDVLPDVRLPSPPRLEIVLTTGFDDSEVDGYLTRLREQAADLTQLGRAARAGDVVVIDLAATRHGQAVEHGQAIGVTHTVGSGHPLRGLDEALPGLSVGDQVSIETELVGGRESGRSAQLSIMVRQVTERTVPELDDEFAARFGEFADLAEFRAVLRTRLLHRAGVHLRADACERAVDALADEVGIEAPAPVVAEELRRQKKRMAAALDRIGVSLDDYLAAEEATEPMADAELAGVIARRIRAEITLDLLAHQHDLFGSGEEANESEAVRSRALAYLMKHVVIRDQTGERVSFDALYGPVEP
ncbi:hypothetical protein ACFQO7_34055 [Catellatospora aurea]|uniref:Trigger factor C-terminal domain-containing protein n=1 Tax=Catellatospora aurea TaxID=1337874 RepID=A0ABW2HB05_9ACTN